MRTALANGQVDAIWTPEPFLSQALTLDGARIVMAPGPVLGNYFPNGGYAALHDWIAKDPGLAKRFTTAMNESLVYAQSHPDEVRALLPAALRNIRLAVWTSKIDRPQLLQLAKYAKQYGVIGSLPNFTQLFPSAIRSGAATGLLEGKVDSRSITMKTAGVTAKRLDPGSYLVVVTDKSNADNLHLSGPGVNKRTSVGGTGVSRWKIQLSAGRYTFRSDKHPNRRGSFTVS
jgi:ABC-type nitrate/sulfonate/bicarbonate transport system substrate-binding protein